MNTSKIKSYAAHYFYGLFIKSFTGGVSALDAFLGLAAGAAVSVDIQAINWKGAVAVFAVTFLRTALSYFKDKPFPDDFPDEVVTEKTEVVTTSSVSTKPNIP